MRISNGKVGGDCRQSWRLVSIESVPSAGCSCRCCLPVSTIGCWCSVLRLRNNCFFRRMFVITLRRESCVKLNVYSYNLTVPHTRYIFMNQELYIFINYNQQSKVPTYLATFSLMNIIDIIIISVTISN